MSTHRPLLKAPGAGGGGGGCLGPCPAPADPPGRPHQKTFPPAKNEIYQRGRFSVHKLFFWPLTHPPILLKQ